VCPEIFGGHDDGLFYVKEPEWPSIVDKGDGVQSEPIYQMATGMASVPDRLVNATIEAAEDCPGECIFIELID
jgi:ferredoxin